MRASGRGGRQGPRGDPVPPRALLRYGYVRAGPFRARGDAARGPLPRLAGFLCAESLYV